MSRQMPLFNIYHTLSYERSQNKTEQNKCRKACSQMGGHADVYLFLLDSDLLAVVFCVGDVVTLFMDRES